MRAAGTALLLTLISSSAALAQSPAGARVVDDAAAALGGRDRILGVRTLTIEGYGSNPNIGQAMTPESDPLLWMIPDYKRSLDLENGRMELSFTRRPAFPAVFDNFRFARRSDRNSAVEQRMDMLHHPLTLLRAALDPAAKIGAPRQNGTQRSVDVTTAQGDTLTLTVDALNRPVSIRNALYHVNLGDTERVTTFGAYEDLDGLRLPKRIVTRLDKWVEYDIGVMKHTLDADLNALAAPVAPGGPGNPAPMTATPVAKGIWFVTDGGGNPSLIVEFADHVALVEVPGGDARVQALIDKAGELVPGKPVTQAIVTHHHFDHTGGLRAAVARGLTIVTHRVNEAWFREAVARRHTLQPDALAKAPRALKLVTFDDSYTLRDASMEMVLQHLANSTHGDGILSVYFPRERVYAEVDVWNPGAQIQPHLRSLADEIARRTLAIDRVIPMHGNQVQPYAELEKVIEEWRGRRVTTTTYKGGP